LNTAINLWQTKPVDEKELKEKYDYGIVLGGFSSYEEEIETLNFNDAVDRILVAVQLYHEGRIKKILISSGSANIFNSHLKEADYVKEFLISIKIPEKDIVIENQSKNTFENAKFTAELLGEKKEKSTFLLITSSMHMKRAKACFKKQRVEADIYVVDYLTGFEDFDLNFYFFPKFDVILAWRHVFHEIIGYYVYKKRGYL